MLLTGQPLHAFDLDQVPGGELIVRTASEGEKMITLDGVERTFDADTVLVCDRNGPPGIAGIMGGQISEVSENTTRVLLEVANWNGPNILRTSRLLGLRSEASGRFEKQLHPELCMRAQRVASRLLVELCGAKLVPGTIDVAAGMPEPHGLTPARRAGRAAAGHADTRGATRPHTSSASASPSARARTGSASTVPPDRHYDVTREADLIEEVARVHGLDGHAAGDPPRDGRPDGRAQPRPAAAAARRGRPARPGLRRDRRLELRRPRPPEAAADPGDDDPRSRMARIDNPLAEDASMMRTTLLGSLLDAAHYNVARGAERLALFESGRAYLLDGETSGPIDPLAGRFPGEQAPPVLEPHRLAALATGDPPPSLGGWRARGGASSS